ncbi:3-mercaptopyruvate sulfurtransferase [Enterobacter hormaechei]
MPGAVFFDIEALSNHTSSLPHMLPRPEAFSVAMRELGISKDKHLVVYDEGNLFSAPRAWWMLKNFGVEKVSILAGGLAGWKRDELPLQQGDVTLPEGEFDATFDANVVEPDRRAGREPRKHGANRRCASRSTFQRKSGRAATGTETRTYPGGAERAVGRSVFEGELKTTDELRAIFERQGVDLHRPVIASCGSGVTACVVILALATLGANDVTLYDQRLE